MKPPSGLLRIALWALACLVPVAVIAQEPPEVAARRIQEPDKAFVSGSIGGAFPVGNFKGGGHGQADAPNVVLEAQVRFPLTHPSKWELGGVVGYRQFSDLSLDDLRLHPPSESPDPPLWEIDGWWKIITVESRITSSFALRPDGDRWFVFLGLGLSKAMWGLEALVPGDHRDYSTDLDPAFVYSIGGGRRWNGFFLEGAYKRVSTQDKHTNFDFQPREVGFPLEWVELKIGYDVFSP